MAKHNKNLLNGRLKNILLFLCLIPFIYAEIKKAEYTQKNGDRIQTIQLVCDTRLPFYIKVKLTPGENTITPHLCVSNTDSNCKDNRITFGNGVVGGSSSVFVRREQIDEDGEGLFALVTCEEEKCSYTVTFEGGQAAEIDVNSVFSYVVSKENRNMKFQVMGDAHEGSYLTIGIEGSSSAELDMILN